jgi:hypothetical protein
MNSKEGSWVQWLTQIRKVQGTIACQKSDGLVQMSEPRRRGTRVIRRRLDCLKPNLQTTTVAGEFLAFTAGRGGLAALDGAVIGAFVTTLGGYQAKAVEHKQCAVRSLLRFAADGGLTGTGVLEAVPAVRSVRQARIPSVWDPADVTKIIEAIDRSNPSGKRD